MCGGAFPVCSGTTWQWQYWQVDIAGTLSDLNTIRIFHAHSERWQLTISIASFPLACVSTHLERPMKIEIIVDPARPPTLSQRVAPAPAVVAATVPTTVATTNGTRRLVVVPCGRFHGIFPYDAKPTLMKRFMFDLCICSSIACVMACYHTV